MYSAPARCAQTTFCWAIVSCAIVFCQSFCSSLYADSGFANFVTAQDAKLMDGDQPFRFISFNIPNLSYIEDNMQFDQTTGFRLPTQFEIDDALASIQQMGGRVARIYVLSVHKVDDPLSVVRHILSPDQLNEQAMVVLDQVLAAANKHGVRLIIPFVDQASWWGGIQELAAFRGKAKADFFTDPQLKDDYKHIVSLVINRVNTCTGVKYKDDKAVLAWELGNELRAPKEWVREMAPYVKQIDGNHLVAESYFTDPDNPGVDIVQDHLYQGNPEAMVQQIHRSIQRAAGHKVYMVGEFGFVTTEGMRDVINTVIHEPAAAGALIWSLRFHDNDGGYYWHHEPHGGDFFKAYHWPGGPMGEPYDETRFMKMVRDKAYEIQNKTPPALKAPASPELIEVTDGGVVNWRGAAGASSYDLRRIDKPNAAGPWDIVAYHLTDDASQYHPLAVDESVHPGDTYWYRLTARNEAGESSSNIFGPVHIHCRTLVDELNNLSHTYRSGGQLEIKSNDARNFKEDCYRLAGSPGAWVAYKAPGHITGARIYAFGDKQAPELEFRAGSDSEKGDKLDPQSKDFYAGKEMYNYRWPRLYTLGPLPKDSDSFTITFTKEAQISRVEVEYQ